MKLRWNYNPPVEFANEDSQFHYKFWEKHDITVQPVITYIYLCVLWYAASSSYFSKPSNWIIGQVWKNLYIVGILSYPECWCIVPFSSNISCDLTHKVYLCFDYWIRNSVIYQSLNDLQQGTQQEYSATKLAVIIRYSCNSNAWQSEWGFAQ